MLAILPGVANAVLTAEQLDTPLTHEHFAAAGSGLGAAGFIVYDDSACMVEVSAMLSRFLYVESCGQCPPCKLGTGAITEALDRIRTGDGRDADLDTIQRRLQVVADGNRCYLPVQERELISSFLRAFPEDVVAHLDGHCPSDRAELPVPKIVDLADGVVTALGRCSSAPTGPTPCAVGKAAWLSRSSRDRTQLRSALATGWSCSAWCSATSTLRRAARWSFGSSRPINRGPPGCCAMGDISGRPTANQFPQ
jgi:hypothetical protein